MPGDFLCQRQSVCNDHATCTYRQGNCRGSCQGMALWWLGVVPRLNSKSALNVVLLTMD